MNLSRISIGKSNSNIKDYSFKTDYSIKNVVMDPFGSNKMRIHYPSNYNFKIENVGDRYNIKTIRNIKNRDLSNSIYFPNVGWTNHLTVTCIMNEFKLTTKYIIDYIPENYGELEICGIENPDVKYKVGIVIPTFGRLNYVKRCFESLRNSNLQNTIIIIVDESTTKDKNDDRLNTHKFIKLFEFKTPCIKIYKNKHGNMYDSIQIGLDIVGNVCEYLMTMDSDTIHNGYFIEQTLNTYKQIKLDNENKLIIISGFNTNKHPITKETIDYYIKDTIGGCHLCFRTEDYWKYIRYTLISYKWDTNIYRLVNRLDGIIATTKPSVIEHIGEISSVRTDDIPCDKSIDFDDIYKKKIYIVGEDVYLENNQTWIIDIFKKEFTEYSKLDIVTTPEESEIIWIIGNNNLKEINYLKTIHLTNKQIITTIHHIDWNKIDMFNINFNEVKDITTRFHVICDKVYHDLIKLTDKSIRIANFWINENIFYNISNKNELRKEYNIPEKSFCVGSFQRDTKGKRLCMKPKLSKGPDIFIEIVKDMNKKRDNVLVILSGRRRNYIIKQLEDNGIEYLYFPMVTSVELNKLYNCLDLYIVSSRVEGGPRSILECGITKTPIISTDVGIANLILDNKSIYDVQNPLSYCMATPNIQHTYDKASLYSINNYLNSFIKYIL